MVVIGHAFHRNAEVQFTVHHIDCFADLHIRNVAHVDHGGIHTHAAKNRAELSANEHETLVVFATQVTVAVTDGNRCNAGGLLGHPVTTVAHSFSNFHIVNMANGRLDSHHRLNRPWRRCCTHAVVTVKG